MGIKKNIIVDEKEVPFKASAAIPRMYRLKFGRDIYRDFTALQNSMQEQTDGESLLNIDSLEVFENIAFIMAKHADTENVPNEPDEWLEQFSVFSIYEIMPQLIELWGMNMETQAVSKKNIAQLTEK